jgi:pimeloyl-ACP methyl ester carboxylesterase
MVVYHSSHIKLPAGQIFWREAGDLDRPVLVFLHGSWHDNHQWDRIIEPLAAHFHCFAVDLLGFGNSVANRVPNSIEMEVDTLNEFLTALKLRPVYLVGHSLGAWIALSYTLKYPDLVRGIVAISPEGYTLPNWQQYGLPTKILLSQPWLFALSLKSLQVIASIGDGAYPLAKRQTYLNFFKKYPTTCKLFFQRSNSKIRRELVADRLGQLRQPLLVLQSDADDRAVIEQSQACARAVRKSEYQLIKSADFTFPEESMPYIAKEIERFLDRIQVQVEREEVELW